MGLEAFSRAKVRTCLGQRAKTNPYHHLAEKRGWGTFFGRESQFTPHIFSIICDGKFIDWFNLLPDKGGFEYRDDVYQLKPYKVEVLSFLKHVIIEISNVRLEWDEAKQYKEKAEKILTPVLKENSAVLEKRMKELMLLIDEVNDIPASPVEN